MAQRTFSKVYQLLDNDGDDCDGGSHLDPLLDRLSSASIQRRIATGPRRGFPLRRLVGGPRPSTVVLGARCAEVEGFNIHANTRLAANQRPRLESLCRYIARPPLSDDCPPPRPRRPGAPPPSHNSPSTDPSQTAAPLRSKSNPRSPRRRLTAEPNSVLRPREATFQRAYPAREVLVFPGGALGSGKYRRAQVT